MSTPTEDHCILDPPTPVETDHRVPPEEAVTETNPAVKSDVETSEFLEDPAPIDQPRFFRLQYRYSEQRVAVVASSLLDLRREALEHFQLEEEL